jgi:8-oxo-dGTP diphosphatase
LKIFKKYALCIIRNNRLLLQMGQEVDHYTLPGGKAEEDEGAIQALCREVREELGIEVDIASLEFLGEYEEVVDGDDLLVQVDLYQGNCHGQMKICSEVKKLIWFGKDDDWNKLAPVTKNKIMPVLVQKGLLT